MNRATILFREGLHYRIDAFAAGLKALGYETATKVTRNAAPGDVLVIWNRMGEGHSRAREYEAVGAKVLVVENGYLGKDFRGEQWFAMSLGHHNGAGKWPGTGVGGAGRPVGGPERWDSWGVDLAPWRKPGGECVVLAQRGIGEPGLRSPGDWTPMALAATRGRIRRHPGVDGVGISLETDLVKASMVATWSSGAALKALVMGIPVFYGMPRWIGAPAARPLATFREGPLRDDETRLAMFRRLAWAMASMSEIESGEAFKRILL